MIIIKHLINYCPIDVYEEEIGEGSLESMLEGIGIDGIEHFIYQEDFHNLKYKDLTVGVHLKYWPYWLDFYLGKKNKPLGNPEKNKTLKEYFWQARTPEEWLTKIENHILQAAMLNPEYMVWHVAEANDESIFTYSFDYTNMEVLDNTISIINKVTSKLSPDIKLLFENLWWPGLTLLNPREVDYFFSRINHPNIGIMLDTGHMMNTNMFLQSEDDAVNYIIRTIKALGQNSKLVQGFHLSCSLSGEYLRTFKHEVPENCDMIKIWQHITSIDGHKPFKTEACRRLIDIIAPKYVNHELAYSSLHDMCKIVKKQLNNC